MSRLNREFGIRSFRMRFQDSKLFVRINVEVVLRETVLSCTFYGRAGQKVLSAGSPISPSEKKSSPSNRRQKTGTTRNRMVETLKRKTETIRTRYV